MREKAEDLAADRWPEILMAAGMDASYFSGKHGPCPFCGGSDRYRWSKKHGGVWVCNVCTQERWGNGMRMLMEHMGYSQFIDAADHVREYIYGAGHAHVRRNARVAAKKADPIAEIERQKRKMATLWEATREVIQGDPVDLYLHNRVCGLDFLPRMVRFHPQLDYWSRPDDPDGKPVLIGKFPAMVAKCFDAKGNFVQLHKTYLTADGRKADVPKVKKLETGIGAASFVVPMCAVKGDTLGFAEGIESSLAGAMLRGIPVWSCLSGPSMAAFDLPEQLQDQVRNIVVFEDNDPRRLVAVAGGEKRWRSAGVDYARKLGERMRQRGKRVLFVKAAKVGTDMADFWNERQQREAVVA